MTITSKNLFPNEVKDTRFNPTFIDRGYTTTKSNFKITNNKKDTSLATMEIKHMGDDEFKSKLSGLYKGIGMEKSSTGYLPNLGKKYMDLASGAVSGISALADKDMNLDTIMSSVGTNKEEMIDTINSGILGTDENYMKNLSTSINQSVGQSGGVTTLIQPVINNVQVPTPVPQPTPVPVKGKTNTIVIDSSNQNILAKYIR